MKNLFSVKLSEQTLFNLMSFKKKLILQIEA